MRRTAFGCGVCVLTVLGTVSPSARQPAPAGGFVLQEATIGSIHTAFASGQLTCVQLVQRLPRTHREVRRQGPVAERASSPSTRRRSTSRRRWTGCAGSGAPPAALHPGDRQGQLRHRRHGDHRRLGDARAIGSASRRLRRQAAAGSRRDRPRQVEPDRAGAGRDDGELARRADEKSLRSDAHPRRLERRHGRGDCGKFRRARHRQRYGAVDSVAGLGAEPGRAPPDARPRQPRRHHPVQHHAG